MSAIPLQERLQITQEISYLEAFEIKLQTDGVIDVDAVSTHPFFLDEMVFQMNQRLTAEVANLVSGMIATRKAALSDTQPETTPDRNMRGKTPMT